LVEGRKLAVESNFVGANSFAQFTFSCANEFAPTFFALELRRSVRSQTSSKIGTAHKYNENS